MRRSIAATILSIVTVIAPALADDFSAGLPKVREFLKHDRSYSQSERTEAEAELAKLEATAANMPLAAFHLAVAHIAALSGNGHTMLPAGLWMFSFNRIPLRLHVFADGTHVVHAPKEMHELLGARVISIDGHAMDELRTAFGQYFGARSGKRDEWVGYFVESAQLLHAAGLAKSDGALEIEFELSNGASSQRTVPAALDAPDEEPLNWLDSSRLVSYAAENVESAGVVPYAHRGERRNFAVAHLRSWRRSTCRSASTEISASRRSPASCRRRAS